MPERMGHMGRSKARVNGAYVRVHRQSEWGIGADRIVLPMQDEQWHLHTPAQNLSFPAALPWRKAGPLKSTR